MRRVPFVVFAAGMLIAGLAVSSTRPGPPGGRTPCARSAAWPMPLAHGGEVRLLRGAWHGGVPLDLTLPKPFVRPIRRST